MAILFCQLTSEFQDHFPTAYKPNSEELKGSGNRGWEMGEKIVIGGESQELAVTIVVVLWKMQDSYGIVDATKGLYSHDTDY